MAYPALLSLSQILGQIQIHDQYPLFLEKEKLVFLQENVSTMLTFLEDHSRKRSESIILLESRIVSAAYQFEDIIESQLSSLYLSESKNITRNFESISSNLEVKGGDLHKVFEEIDLVMEKVMQIKNNNNNNLLHLPEDTPPSASVSLSTLTLNDTMVGFDDDFSVITNRIYQKSSNFEIIPIVGMGGIGKSTLAKKLYEESIRTSHFDRRAWIVVSHEYSFREILMGLLLSINVHIGELNQKKDGELVELLHKELFGRRYLIVLDDVWSTKICDELNIAFPKDTNGSRVLLTTRLSNVASYVGSFSSPPHEMHFLSKDQSWKLLEERVFQKEESCPFHLEQIGMEIAKGCRGLPLTIVVVAGLLKENITKEHWGSISRNISSEEPTIAQHYSKVLFLSYDHLPLYLKPCFLYVTAFPEDSAIDVTRLVKLWVAEGFIKPSGSNSKHLEDVAEGFLDDLVKRNLLLVTKKRFDGKIKAVGIHDVLRDMGIKKSQEERFLYPYHLGRINGEERRLTTHVSDNFRLRRKIRYPTTRSLLMFCRTYFATLLKFRLLRILDALTCTIEFDPGEFMHLRYLALKHDYPDLPNPISRLRNLQSLIIHGGKSFKTNLGFLLPPEIWKMPSLRHLIVLEQCHVEHPRDSEAVVGTNLQTLSLVTNLRFTEHVIKMLENIRKLGLLYIDVGVQDWEGTHLRNLACLRNLESLKIISYGYEFQRVKMAFPPNIKKLTLEYGFCPWENVMDEISSLPNLEVLKLRSWFLVEGWNLIEDRFPKLKYLELECVDIYNWEVDSGHFPSLEILVLKHHGKSAKEIPSSLGEIVSLRLIELHDCLPSIVDSAKQIVSEQLEMGNYDLHVRIVDENAGSFESRVTLRSERLHWKEDEKFFT